MAKNITRWNDPFTGLTSLHSQIDDMFNDLFGGAGAPMQASPPAIDVYEDDGKALVTEVQVSGFNKDDISVSVHEGVLEIKGEKHEKEEDKKQKRTYMVRESSASFYRRIALPKQADGDNIDAHFEDGMLKVRVPYKELPKPRKIEIKSRDTKK